MKKRAKRYENDDLFPLVVRWLSKKSIAFTITYTQPNDPLIKIERSCYANRTQLRIEILYTGDTTLYIHGLKTLYERLHRIVIRYSMCARNAVIITNWASQFPPII